MAREKLVRTTEVVKGIRKTRVASQDEMQGREIWWFPKEIADRDAVNCVWELTGRRLDPGEEGDVHILESGPGVCRTQSCWFEVRGPFKKLIREWIDTD